MGSSYDPPHIKAGAVLLLGGPHGRLTEVGVVLFIGGILLLAFLLNRVVKRIRYRDTGNMLQPPPRNPGVLAIIPALLMIILAQGCFWLGTQLQYFRPVRDDGIIARIQVERQTDPIKSLKVSYYPIVGDSLGMANIFFLSGDSWRFSGEALNFNFANKYLDLPARSYKIIGFDSRFLERLPPNVSAALLDENMLEGGRSAAYSAFRNNRLFKWFATADSFGIDFLTTRQSDSYAVRLRPNSSVALVAE
jgi:hypothetical protein